MNFKERFKQITEAQNSLLCVGLDPDLRRLPESIKSEPDPLFKFCSEIIENTKHVVAAFKFNLAFFEAEGSKGWVALEKLLEIIPSKILKIADTKRADIGSSSEMYARAFLQKLNFDAATVNPYMGRDSVEPFLQWPEKGAFVLCLTSNPGAHDFQYFLSGQKFLYIKVLEEVLSWNSNQNCGLVIGATQPNQLETIRSIAPDLPFLIPGLGVQGGNLTEAVIKGTDKFGQSALFVYSRSIIYKSSDADFAEAARKKAEQVHGKINQIRSAKLKP